MWGGLHKFTAVVTQHRDSWSQEFIKEFGSLNAARRSVKKPPGADGDGLVSV